MPYIVNSNYSAPDMKVKHLSNFRGVDCTKAELDVADFRASNMQNFIFKDGINQKRNGFEQVFKNKSNYRVNGYWELIDKTGEKHCIAHIGSNIYEIDYSDKYNSIARVLEINYELENPYGNDYRINDNKSFGIIRGDRLYIFAGKMLVYGDWGRGYELRFVRDNEDTYIPTTTTNIDPIGYKGKSTRASFEEVNMMSTYRKNKLFGSSLKGSINFEKYIPDSGKAGNIFMGLRTVGYKYNGNIDFQISNANFSVAFPSGNVGFDRIKFSVPIIGDGSWHDSYYTNNPEDPGNIDYLPPTIALELNALQVSYNYNKTTGKFDFDIIFGFDEPKINNEAIVEEQIKIVSYKLDSDKLAFKPKPIVIFKNNKYIFNPDGKCQLELSTFPPSYQDSDDFTLDFFNGILNANIDTESKDSSVPNIEILFSTTEYKFNHPYTKIDGCTIGQVFGYNGVENLFVSGNPRFPNIDWHTSMSILADDKTEISNLQNFTYFGELSYAILGNAQTKIKSYLLLNDNTMGILKEQSNNEASLFVREPYFADALDPSGMPVLDFNNKPYQKLYYKQFMAAIGQGCISSYASANLAGDKIFLSENGVFGIELDYNNINTHQRYAKEKSRLINNKLEEFKKSNLENATGIVFENRYYLSLNDYEGTVFVADARFRNSAASEMNDTMGYEWWIWKGVYAYTWFINSNNQLGFGTKDGRICLFNDSNRYEDITKDEIPVTYSYENQEFKVKNNTPIENYSQIKFKKAENVSSQYQIKEIIFDKGELDINGFEVSPKNLDMFYYVSRFFEVNENEILKDDYKIIYIKKDGEEAMPAVISKFDYAKKTFTFISVLLSDNVYLPLQDVQIDSNTVIYRPIFEENNFIFDTENKTIKLLSRGSTESLDPSIPKNNYNYMRLGDSSADVKAIAIKKKPVTSVWFTPFMNMGTNDYSKTLRYFTIVPEHILHGNADVLFLTNGNQLYLANNKGKIQESEKRFQDNPLTKITQGVDFLTYLDNFNLNSFSFEIKNFAKSFTKKMRIRNFNFMMLCIISDNNKNFAIENITLSYVISKRNRGVK